MQLPGIRSGVLVTSENPARLNAAISKKVAFTARSAAISVAVHSSLLTIIRHS
jgi:hypothetical protein